MPPLHEVIAAGLGVDAAAISEDSRQDFTPGWDSLKAVILITEVERAYDVEFDLDQLATATSVRALRDMLHAQGVDVV